jgi:DNA (cytosine-5)-methyltransferase 1
MSTHGLAVMMAALGCTDGKWRPVEPGTFPLAHGLPARVGRLRGYGNAIVPQAAAAFISAAMDVACQEPVEAAA